MIDPQHVQRWNISSDISSRLVGEEGTKAAVTLIYQCCVSAQLHKVPMNFNSVLVQ